MSAFALTPPSLPLSLSVCVCVCCLCTCGGQYLPAAVIGPPSGELGCCPGTGSCNGGGDCYVAATATAIATATAAATAAAHLLPAPDVCVPPNLLCLPGHVPPPKYCRCNSLHRTPRAKHWHRYICLCHIGPSLLIPLFFKTNIFSLLALVSPPRTRVERSHPINPIRLPRSSPRGTLMVESMVCLTLMVESMVCLMVGCFLIFILIKTEPRAVWCTSNKKVAYWYHNFHRLLEGVLIG